MLSGRSIARRQISDQVNQGSGQLQRQVDEKLEEIDNQIESGVSQNSQIEFSNDNEILNELNNLEDVFLDNDFDQMDSQLK